MKIIKILLIVLGILLIVGGLYGIIGVSQAGVDSNLVNLGLNLGDALGVSSYMSFGEKLAFFVLRNRIMLLVVGAISTILGIVLPKPN